MSGQIAPAAGEVLGQMVRAAAVPMALVLVDGFVVEAASPAFEAIVRAPIVGASLTESYPGATDLHDVLKLAAQGQGHQRAFGVEAFGVGLGPAATNAAMQWDWAATPVPDGAGGVGAVLVVASDVAGQIEAAERIEMLEGLVFLSRRVSGAEDEAALYRLLAEDIGQLLGAGVHHHAPRHAVEPQPPSALRATDEAGLRHRRRRAAGCPDPDRAGQRCVACHLRRRDVRDRGRRR